MATKTAPKISDLYNALSNPGGGFGSANDPFTSLAKQLFQSVPPASAFPGAPAAAPAGANMSTPNGPVVAQNRSLSSMMSPAAPVVPTRPAAPVASSGPIFKGPSSAPVGPQGATGAAPANQSPIPPQYLKADGTIKTPAEIAGEVGSTLSAAHSKGDVGTLALDQFGGNGKTAIQLEAEARKLNNTRNDIAVGETDPYKVASDSGIAYTPAELKAIENAYAGIYDPALDTALAKVNAKQTADAADKDFQNSLEKMKTQFGYDKALKQTPAAAAAGSGSGISSGVYVPGQNPTVDAWAQRIFDGSAKITDIPASDKGLRNAVTVALQASGNDLAGKPTVTELGRSAAASAKSLLEKLNNREGTSAVGGSRFFTGGPLAFPGSEKANFQIDFQNLKDTLSLDGVKYLKGQGAVSDAERALLASAVTKLNLSQSEDEFKTTLEGIVNRLTGGADQSTLPPTMVLNGQTLMLQSDGTYE